MIPAPPPLQSPQPDPGQYSLIQAELAFAAASERVGQRAAFLAVWHPDGLLFTPSPVNGPQHSRQQPETGSLLSWYPAFAETDAEGRWAYTSGPWEFRQDPTAKDPLRHGRFFSVWHREKEGGWRLIADGRCPGEAGDRNLPRLLPEHPARPAHPIGLKAGEEDRLLALDLPRLPTTGQLAYLHGTADGRIWFRLWFKAAGQWRLRIAWEAPL